jgi:hypothetical protein
MSRGGQKTKVFISYAHKDDSELASRLCTDLAGVDDAVWLDKDRVIGGSNWSQVIEKQIDSADVIKAKNDKVTLQLCLIAHTSLPC